MRAGRVVRIRVNPKDCMSCVDIAQKVGLVTTGMSFAQVVSMALAASMQTFRERGLVPQREGFEYAEMMRPFADQPSEDKGRTRKLQITETAHLAGSEFHVPAVVAGKPTVDQPNSPAWLRKKRRADELVAKREADPQNFSQGEQDELTSLADELFT